MLVAFEGPIAAGKTTLAGLYAEYSNSTLVLEEFSANEFLADYYADNSRWALPMQLWFLLDRHTQMLEYAGPRDSIIVADYSYLKNEIFAHAWLGGREWRLFERTAKSLGSNLPETDLFVYLDAKNGILLDRIRKRGRSYESTINESYQDKLRSAYGDYLGSGTSRAVIQFDTTTLDLSSKAELTAIFTAIDEKIREIAKQSPPH